METVYVFMGHFGSSMAHTLFAFPIDLCNGNGNGDEKNRRIEPIIEFPAPEYPLVMASAQLGSRIYFVGGERDSWQSELEANQKYPPDVYVFDEQQKTQKLEVGMKMNTGKPSPVAFAADGKLFVLGSCGGPSLISYAFLWPTGLASSSMRFFEVFDPTTNEWTLLDDPPVTTPTIWVSSVVVGRRVYVYGRIVGEGTSGVVLSFHLDSYEWESEHSNDPQFQQLRRHMPNRILLGDTYYGLSQRDDWVVRQKLTEEDEQLLFRLRGADYYESTSGFCHLWDTLFCTVVTGSLHDPGVPGIMLDQYRRFFSIRVFREIQGPLPESISTDLLYSAGYLFQSTYSSIGPLLGCYTFLHSDSMDPLQLTGCLRDMHLYFASHEDFEIIFFFLAFQEIKESLKKTHHPVRDFLLKTQLLQSESQ